MVALQLEITIAGLLGRLEFAFVKQIVIAPNVKLVESAVEFLLKFLDVTRRLIAMTTAWHIT